MSTSLLTPPAEKPSTESLESSESRSQSREEETQELIRSFSPSSLKRDNIDWISLVWIAAMHVGILAAPFFFSWTALGVCLVLHWLTASVGICLGYHRYLAHRSMKLKPPAELFVLTCGAISGEGAPLTWAANHRVHHHRSDHEGDPHSPLVGKWWSHMLWLFVSRSRKQQQILFQHYVPELANRPLLQFFERHYAWFLVGPGVALLAAGFAVYGTIFGALSFLVWGMCVRMVFVYHGTWFVNSATHLWGYRSYETRDKSKNLWWVAVLAYGEGWHNNHHAHPAVAPAGHRWWEIDMTWWSIKALRFLGLATDVKVRIPSGITEETVDGPPK